MKFFFLKIFQSIKTVGDLVKIPPLSSVSVARRCWLPTQAASCCEGPRLLLPLPGPGPVSHWLVSIRLRKHSASPWLLKYNFKALSRRYIDVYLFKFIVGMNFALFTTARLRSILQQYKQKYVSITGSRTLSTGRHDALIIVTRLVNKW